jgi:hypothetical protein
MNRALDCVAVIGACAILASVMPAVAGPPVAVRIAFVGPIGTGARLGVLQGLEEANVQGRFLGRAYVLDEYPDAAAVPADPSGWIALVAATSAAELLELSRRFPDRAIFNATLDDDALRRACRANLLHVAPSRAMIGDAERQWRQVHPDSRASARAWHPDFEKYAAAQLNIRFRKGRGTAMDDHAWAGWAAVKMLSDLLARMPGAEPAELLEALRTRLAFDGQKGAEMSFGDGGQLRQPLLLVENDRIVGEAPVRGAADPHDLDSLGKLACGD